MTIITASHGTDTVVASPRAHLLRDLGASGDAHNGEKRERRANDVKNDRDRGPTDVYRVL
jgi:hypothetical protein